MPGKVAMVIYDRCRPGECAPAACPAAAACKRKLLRQEAPDESPMPHPSLCRGCGDCVRACPFRAIQIGAAY